MNVNFLVNTNSPSTTQSSSNTNVNAGTTAQSTLSNSTSSTANTSAILPLAQTHMSINNLTLPSRPPTQQSLPKTTQLNKTQTTVVPPPQSNLPNAMKVNNTNTTNPNIWTSKTQPYTKTGATYSTSNNVGQPQSIPLNALMGSAFSPMRKPPSAPNSNTPQKNLNQQPLPTNNRIPIDDTAYRQKVIQNLSSTTAQILSFKVRKFRVVSYYEDFIFFSSPNKFLIHYNFLRFRLPALRNCLLRHIPPYKKGFSELRF